MYELLIVGRMFSGAAVGMSGVTTSMYLSEITPVRLRGAAGTAPMVSENRRNSLLHSFWENFERAFFQSTLSLM